MTKTTISMLTAAALVASLNGACSQDDDGSVAGTTSSSATDEAHAGDEAPSGEEGTAGNDRDVAAATASMSPTEGNTVSGRVAFVQTGAGEVTVTIALEGFEPGSTHAIHVHENGDCSAPDGTSAGGHYNPGGHQHGLPESSPRHAGDMGNITAGDDGRVQTTKTFTNITVSSDQAPVLGRSVIVHASEDDGGQPTGNAGARLACGVIEAAE